MTTTFSSEKEENLCSIFHARFTHLRKIIPNTRQAQLMDYILLGWQTSTYKLKNSTQKWFMKEFSKIVEDTGIALSTLKRYLKEFEDEGLIERRQALYSRNSESGFTCKKGCYISVTSKLIFLLDNTNQNIKKQTSTSTAQSFNTQDNNPVQPSENKTNTFCKTEIQHDYSKNFNQNETFEELNLRRLYISDLFNHENNNIKHSYYLKNVDKTDQPRIDSYLNAFEKTLFKNINEEIPDEIKKMVLGTLMNLVIKNKILLSSPEQVAAEYIFALINIDYFMNNVKCMKHRNNILAKLLRKKKWQTPKGFYNYFYLGQNFKDKNELHEKTWEEAKEKEIKNSPVYLGMGLFSNGERHHLLREVDDQIVTIGQLIFNLENNLIGLNGDILIEEKNSLESLTNELHALYRKQEKIEHEIDNQSNSQLDFSTGRVA